MKLSKGCRKCRLELELAAAIKERTLEASRDVVRLKAELAKERHTCRNPRSSRTRGA